MQRNPTLTGAVASLLSLTLLGAHNIPYQPRFNGPSEEGDFEAELKKMEGAAALANRKAKKKAKKK